MAVKVYLGREASEVGREAEAHGLGLPGSLVVQGPQLPTPRGYHTSSQSGPQSSWSWELQLSPKHLSAQQSILSLALLCTCHVSSKLFMFSQWSRSEDSYLSLSPAWGPCAQVRGDHWV